MIAQQLQKKKDNITQFNDFTALYNQWLLITNQIIKIDRCFQIFIKL